MVKMICFSEQKLTKILKGCFMLYWDFWAVLDDFLRFVAVRVILSRNYAEHYAEQRGKRTLNIVIFSLILAIFLLTGTKTLAAETSKFVPSPKVTSFSAGQTLTGQVVILGEDINFSQTKVYLDGQFLGYTQNKIGTLGWQEFSLSLPDNLIFGQHQLDLIAEYFQNTQSPTTTLSFFYQAKFPAPTLFNPVLNLGTNFQQPWLVGLAFNNSELEIYLDDKLDNTFFVTNHASGVASFRYLPRERLTPGFHVVKVRAFSPDNRKSDFSNEIIFEVRQNKQVMAAPDLPNETGNFVPPVPAPTLREPKNGLVTKSQELVVSGVVHNEHFVKLFLDDNLMAEFMPAPHSSGVTSFIWEHNQPLAPGFHRVYAKDINPRGQVSGQSNVLRFIVLGSESIFVSQPQGQIAATNEEQPASTEIEGQKEVAKLKTGGLMEKIKNWSNWWQYALGLVILLALTLIIIWFINYRKEEKQKEKIEIRTKKSEDIPPPPPLTQSESAPTESRPDSTTNYSSNKTWPEAGLDAKAKGEQAEPIIQGPEISYDDEILSDEDIYFQPDRKENKDNDDEFQQPPPPPPPDSPTLGI